MSPSSFAPLFPFIGVALFLTATLSQHRQRSLAKQQQDGVAPVPMSRAETAFHTVCTGGFGIVICSVGMLLMYLVLGGSELLPLPYDGEDAGVDWVDAVKGVELVTIWPCLMVYVGDRYKRWYTPRPKISSYIAILPFIASMCLVGSDYASLEFSPWFSAMGAVGFLTGCRLRRKVPGIGRIAIDGSPRSLTATLGDGLAGGLLCAGAMLVDCELLTLVHGSLPILSTIVLLAWPVMTFCTGRLRPVAAGADPEIATLIALLAFASLADFEIDHEMLFLTAGTAPFLLGNWLNRRAQAVRPDGCERVSFWRTVANGVLGGVVAVQATAVLFALMVEVHPFKVPDDLFVLWLWPLMTFGIGLGIGGAHRVKRVASSAITLVALIAVGAFQTIFTGATGLQSVVAFCFAPIALCVGVWSEWRQQNGLPWRPEFRIPLRRKAPAG